MFLTTGRSGIAAFANSDAWFLIRVVTAPDGTALPRRHKLVLSRGPYGYHDEFALLREQRIDALVTKNSGGKMTRAKLDAAAALGISVVMIARPLRRARTPSWCRCRYRSLSAPHWPHRAARSDRSPSRHRGNQCGPVWRRESPN